MDQMYRTARKPFRSIREVKAARVLRRIDESHTVPLRAPHIDVIIVNWNGLNHLQAGLPSLSRTDYPDYRVIIVDNGSTDGSAIFVRANYPNYVLLQNQENLGFAGGNNVGISFALRQGSEYVALLNNDTRVDPNWLTELVDVAEQDQHIALCEAHQWSWDGRQHLQIKLKPDWLEGIVTPVALQPDRAAYPTAYAAGCCVLIRCSVLAKIGLFDPLYFAYVEDVDISLRAWIAGYTVVSVPRSRVYHRVAGTSQPRQRMYLGYRNQLMTMLKNYEWATLYRFRKSIVARSILTRNRIALRATLSALIHLPHVLTARRRVQMLRRRTDDEIFSLTGLKQ